VLYLPDADSRVVRMSTTADRVKAPGDDACRELLAVHAAFYGEQEADAVYPDLIAARRLVVRLQVRHLYGVMTTAGARPVPRVGSG
jgi:hypothetical protein